MLYSFHYPSAEQKSQGFLYLPSQTIQYHYQIYNILLEEVDSFPVKESTLLAWQASWLCGADVVVSSIIGLLILKGYP